MGVLKDFKPSLLFLARFLAVYFVGNVLYGIYIESFGDRPDPVTRWVTSNTSGLLNSLGGTTFVTDNSAAPTVFIHNNKVTALSVYEGCNGINVMIVFVAFLVAFGGPKKTLAWFLPAGLLIIHGFNLLRIGILYYVSQYMEQYFYFFHKYLFTAVLYAAVFGLWAIWVLRLNNGTRKLSASSE
jgi:exosortase family protein XrtF